MITLKEYLEAIDFKITGGSEFQWKCYGDTARYLDCADNEGLGTYSISAIFDTEDQTVYAVELWDYENDREYRWINPAYVKDHMQACITHNVDVYESCDGRNFIDLDVGGDILDKIAKTVAGEPYDTRVQIEVDFTEEELLQYMKIAHSRDITFNELVEEALRAEIERRKNAD